MAAALKTSPACGLHVCTAISYRLINLILVGSGQSGRFNLFSLRPRSSLVMSLQGRWFYKSGDRGKRAIACQVCNIKRIVSSVVNRLFPHTNGKSNVQVPHASRARLINAPLSPRASTPCLSQEWSGRTPYAEKTVYHHGQST